MINYIIDQKFIPINRSHNYYPDIGVVFQHTYDIFPYEDYYWEAFQKRSGTQIEKLLNDARCNLVAPGKCVYDVGVGNMSFLKSFNGKKYGYDINPVAKKHLLKENMFREPSDVPDEVDTWCCYDVLEHFGDPRELLDQIPINKHLCVSLPIFEDLTQIEKSKHYKENEHRIYFNNFGFNRYMAYAGFVCLSINDEETKIGREGVMSYKFKKESIPPVFIS